MKKSICRFIALVAMLSGALASSAQYGQIANQVTGMLSTILQGGYNYKGYIEASYMKGIGENNGDFVGASTSQGVMYGSNFFMGLGLGVDMLMAHVDESAWAPDAPQQLDRSTTKNGCVVPIFSDFRGIFGPADGIRCQIGLKMGCSFLVSDSYITVNRGYITSNECFYLKPSIGIRVPTSSSNSKQAFNIALAYQLITPGYRNFYGGDSQSITLNSFGITVGFEW